MCKMFNIFSTIGESYQSVEDEPAQGAGNRSTKPADFRGVKYSGWEDLVNNGGI